MGVPEMLSSHPRAPLERRRLQAGVLLGPATTVRPYGTTPPQAGMGPVKSKTREASRLPPSVAFPPARGNLGVVGLQVWPQPEPPVAPQRTNTPLAEQER
jgi:hypothetical protein